MELIKTQMQVHGDGKGPLTVIREIAQSKPLGIRGLGKGLAMTIFREVPACGVYFSSYEVLVRQVVQIKVCATSSTWSLIGSKSCLNWCLLLQITKRQFRLGILLWWIFRNALLARDVPSGCHQESDTGRQNWGGSQIQKLRPLHQIVCSGRGIGNAFQRNQLHSHQVIEWDWNTTTLQSMMNAQLFHHRFWHCHRNVLFMKAIQTNDTPHAMCESASIH